MRMRRRMLAYAGAVTLGVLLACGVLYVGCPSCPSEHASSSLADPRRVPGPEITTRQALEGVHWIHHSSFLIVKGGMVIYIDPVNLTKAQPADLVLVTHPHSDHFSPRDIARVSKAGTRIVCPGACARKLQGYDPTVVSCGDALSIGSVTVNVVPAYSRWYRPLHLRRFGYVGYVVGIDGVRIYHAGDTDLTQEMQRLEDVTIALVPVGGKLFTMNAREAADAVAAMRPRLAIPMHYGEGLNPGQGQEFKALAELRGVSVTIPEREDSPTSTR
jgi:L-ascorbate metabolism protein UlaG (beta-lactamase superfamily)